MQDSTKNEILRIFGGNLRSARKASNLSQEELADKCGLDRSYIGSVERGERNVTLFNIFRISQSIGLSSSKLLEGID